MSENEDTKNKGIQPETLKILGLGAMAILLLLGRVSRDITREMRDRQERGFSTHSTAVLNDGEFKLSDGKVIKYNPNDPKDFERAYKEFRDITGIKLPPEQQAWINETLAEASSPGGLDAMKQRVATNRANNATRRAKVLSFAEKYGVTPKEAWRMCAENGDDFEKVEGILAKNKELQQNSLPAPDKEDK